MYLKILCIVSGVLAAILLTLASMYMDGIVGVGQDGVLLVNGTTQGLGPSFKEVWDKCTKGVLKRGFCKDLEHRTIAGCLGVILAIVQLLAAVTLLCTSFGSNYCYAGWHGVCACIALAAFLLMIFDYGDNKLLYLKTNLTYLAMSTVWITFTDLCFCIASAVIAVLLHIFCKKDEENVLPRLDPTTDGFDDSSISSLEVIEEDDDDDADYRNRDTYGYGTGMNSNEKQNYNEINKMKSYDKKESNEYKKENENDSENRTINNKSMFGDKDISNDPGDKSKTRSRGKQNISTDRKFGGKRKK